MIIKRLLILQIVLALGLGSVFLIPSHTGPGKAGISLVLPKELGIWTSRELPVTQREIDVLAADTGFARRMYTNPFDDEVMVSIVLSGEDMANSIHRPERCLPAQGWTIQSSSRVQVPVPNQRPLEVTRLSNVAERQVAEKQTIAFHNLTYYWFVGSKDVTASHWVRSAIDIKDRVLYGENQRWAYVTVAATVTDNLKKFGRSEAETSKMIEDIIAQLVPELQGPEQKTG